LFEGPGLDLAGVVKDGSGGAVSDLCIAVTDGDFLSVCGAENVDGKERGVVVPGSVEAVEGEGMSAAAENHFPAGEFVVLV